MTTFCIVERLGIRKIVTLAVARKNRYHVYGVFYSRKEAMDAL